MVFTPQVRHIAGHGAQVIVVAQKIIQFDDLQLRVHPLDQRVQIRSLPAIVPDSVERVVERVQIGTLVEDALPELAHHERAGRT